MLAVEADHERLVASLGIVERQLPFAVASALTETARAVHRAVQDEMRGSFDRPTPLTLSAFRVIPATKETQTAEVSRKIDASRKHYLPIEAEGGARPSTATERLLRMRIPTAAAWSYILPADNARLDRYGNWSTGERNQVLSALGAQRDEWANTTARSAKRNRRRATYFVPKSGLPLGVYKRSPSGQIGIVLALTQDAPAYTPRLDFKGVTERTARAQFPVVFDGKLAAALASAR